MNLIEIEICINYPLGMAFHIKNRVQFIVGDLSYHFPAFSYVRSLKDFYCIVPWNIYNSETINTTFLKV
jgi:hypothetical protein